MDVAVEDKQAAGVDDLHRIDVIESERNDTVQPHVVFKNRMVSPKK